MASGPARHNRELAAADNRLPDQAAAVRGPCAPAVAHHWALLALSSAVVALAAMLHVTADGHVALPVLRSVPLPALCASRRLLGVPCPGCGLTRSFISLAHGQLAAAWYWNAAGLVLFPFVVGQIPYRMMQIRRARRGKPLLKAGDWSWFAYLVVVVLIAQWIFKLLHQWM